MNVIDYQRVIRKFATTLTQLIIACVCSLALAGCVLRKTDDAIIIFGVKVGPSETF